MKDIIVLPGGRFVVAMLTSMLLTSSLALAQAQQDTTAGDDTDVYSHYEGGYYPDTSEDDWYYDYYDVNNDTFDSGGAVGTGETMSDQTMSDENIDTNGTEPDAESDYKDHYDDNASRDHFDGDKGGAF